MSQHASLTAERWARFSLAQQILQIGAEMQRALALLRPDRLELRRGCYERTLRLTDLTVEVQERPALRRELLRWREVVAGLYLSDVPDDALHRRALRALFLLNGETARQAAGFGPGSGPAAPGATPSAR